MTDTHREQITDPEAVLYRPIVRAWYPNGTVMPDAFKLNQRDKADSNRLSIARGDAVTAEQAYNERAEAVRKRCEENGKSYQPPVGVLAVTIDQVTDVEIKSGDSETRKPLTAWDDSMNDHIPDSHGHIDYNDVPPSDKGAHELAAKALLAKALQNGWKFGPSS
ncbi:endo-1,4-beta-xylanase [Rhodococcus rhodochrous]|uniref:Endo-1,4-beta-xylanase n=1 Tax=Rhodococcus rhodochrous TaxID=1829 RepID=A0AAW4XQ41_RHORH|nr:endo-1,4-beta-xylanase [Rhodococcus rhodochrous]MCD2115004.1 endo-1,4-beta-xylanase [Rhodococcus rhodochrous]